MEQGEESSRTRKGRRSQRAVIAAAHTLFLNRGYHGTSVRDIAEASGLTIGGLYAHWPDKESIWGAVLDAYHPLRRLMPVFEQVEADSLDSLFGNLAHRMVETLGGNRVALNLLFIELVEFQGRHFSSAFPELFPAFVDALKSAFRRLGLALPYSPRVIVRSFFGLIFSYFMTSIVSPGNLPLDDQSLEEFVSIYVHGISHDPPSKDGQP